MSTLVYPTVNRLIDSLAPGDRKLLDPHLASVKLKCRQRLESANRRVDTAYFVDGGIVSVVATTAAQRRQSEVGLIGREGMTGLSIVLGAGRSPYDTIMHTDGVGRGIAADALCRLLVESASLTASLLRYAYVFSVQAGHTALANARGKIEERLARWLLMAHDRLESDNLPITHEFLSGLLGVRRAGVTMALHQLEAAALIATTRGHVTILDRCGLEASANGLYGVPEAEFDRLFNPGARATLFQ
jgi:CRP-like cAMP-binding protein